MRVHQISCCLVRATDMKPLISRPSCRTGGIVAQRLAGACIGMLLLLLPLPGAQAAIAQVEAKLILTNASSQHSLGSIISYLEDPGKQLNPADVVRRTATFVRNISDTPNFGYTDSAYWLSFTIANGAATRKNWILDLDYPLIDDIRLYRKTPAGYQLEKTGGRHLPYDKKDIPSRCFAFNLTIPREARRRSCFAYGARIPSRSRCQFIRPNPFLSRSGMPRSC